MGVNLKLEIFRISLKEIGGSKSDLKLFKELFEKIDSNKAEAYNKFVAQTINHFDNAFILNASEDKGISTSEGNNFKIGFEKNVINGEFKGGPTGIEQEILKTNNNKEKIGSMSHDDIATMPFYFKLWTPFDHNTGVLMIQSYSNTTVSSLVKTHITKIFNTFGYSLIITPEIPNSLVDKYKNDSKVYKVAYVKERLTKSKRKLLNPIFTDFENLSIRIEVSGFKKDVNDFWSKFSEPKKKIGSNLKDFDIKEEEDYEVYAYYIDSEGHKSYATLNRQDIKPTVFLPSAIKKSEKQTFDFELIINHTDSILEEIKKKIGYTK
jgi:hypothetical protein